jgi:hypothetical protein
MDARTLLALMTKAKQVFETGDTFLSFPALSPPVYSPEELAFAAEGLASTDHLAELVEFARLTNVMPTGVIAPTSSEEYLWEVYDEVLRTARVAAGTLGPAEQSAYDAAMALLYVPTEGGLRQESEALRRYRELRDLHIQATEEYRNRQLTAETSDPADAEAWAAEEPALRQAVADVEARWAGEGRRAEVEAALQVEEATAARAPSRFWDQWKTSFMGAVDTLTGTDLSSVAPTGFSPADVTDDEWPSFTLTRPEIERLAAEAPAELTAVLGGTAAQDVEKVTFEYRSVALDRAWLRPALFRSRFWRLGEAGGELSDGGDPPSGRCPSYVAALVLARKVVVERRDGSGRRRSAEPPDRLVRMPDQFRRRLDPRLLRPVPDRRLERVVLVRGRAGSEAVAAAASPTITRERVRDHRTTVPGRRPQVIDHRRPVVDRPVPRPAPPVVDRPRPPVRDHRRPRPLPLPPPRPRPEPDPAPPPPEPPSDDVTVLAYICKRLPRCPDPDPALRWQ